MMRASKGLTLVPGDDPASIGISFGEDWNLAMHTINLSCHSHGVVTFGDPAVRDRIVACINACVGIPTEALEADVIADVVREATMWQGSPSVRELRQTLVNISAKLRGEDAQ